MEYTAKQVNESRKEALEKIKKFLEAENVDEQFIERSGDYYSKDKFIVSWLTNYNGMPSECSIDKCDSFYASYSGYRAIYSNRSLFHEKQLGGYNSIERALIEVGMKLCSKSEKKEFFEKYATKYNSKLQKERENNSLNSANI